MSIGKLRICRGLPGSGKSTVAKRWVAEDPDHRVRLNRDDLRWMLADKGYGLTRAQEDQVSLIQKTAAKAALVKGHDVVIDDTNLNPKFAKEWLKLAAGINAEVEWWDEFLHVPVQTCIVRDRERANPVGSKVIMDFFQRYFSGGRVPAVPQINGETIPVHARYEGTPGAPKAFLVDLDGTVALNGPDRDHPNRGWFDWDRVDEDLPNQPVIDVIHDLYSIGYSPVFVSGRTDERRCRELTQGWIEEHLGYYSQRLIMRETNCGRKDSVVKLELFDKYIRDNYDVKFCFDDRNSVVQSYRSIGLTVFQVADGEF